MTAPARPEIVEPSRAVEGSLTPEAFAEAPNLTPPPGNPRFPLFDSLRAIAALCVFLGHSVTDTMRFAAHPNLYVYAVELADQGVAIFFLISGFLLYRPFLVARRGGPRLSIPAFARRRVLRIVPAYWAALTIFILLGVVNGVSSDNWWIFYGFGQVYSASHIANGIGAAWTLCIEVTFYIALPIFSVLAARLARQRGSVRADLVLLLVLSAASLVFRAHFNRFSDFATVSTLAGTFTWFAFGMVLAIASVTQPTGARGAALFSRAAEHPVLCWAGAVLAFVALHRIALHDRTVSGALAEHVLYAVAAVLILLPGAFAEERSDVARRVLRFGFLAWIGLISYGFYLYHTIVIPELAKPFAHTATAARWALVLVGSFVLTCACAALSYYGLERPCMRWGRRRRVTAKKTTQQPV